MMKCGPPFTSLATLLHGMFSNVKYPRFSGTSVPRDFVEYPSQVNEMWAILAGDFEKLRETS